MIAEHGVIYDGQKYEAGEEIHDLGSFECVGSNGNKRDYQGLSADVSKLPHYVAGGSTAMCLDTQDYYVFHQKTDTWVLQ